MSSAIDRIMNNRSFRLIRRSRDTRVWKKHRLRPNGWLGSEKKLFCNPRCWSVLVLITAAGAEKSMHKLWKEKIRTLLYRPKSCELSAFLPIPFVYLLLCESASSGTELIVASAHTSSLPLRKGFDRTLGWDVRCCSVESTQPTSVAQQQQCK